ncbi:MAG: hypothetical protein M3680_35775 [Myxococcota bacterium]|nr:hypothetical protein [Myxococcota bacterium]
MASVPAPALLGPRERPENPSNRDPMPREDQRQASATAAAAIARTEVARTRDRLPSPHKAQPATASLRTPVDLHDLVGRREKREPFVATLGWAHELGLRADAVTATELIAWAERTHRLHAASEQPQPGDLLIFDRTASEDPADLIAIVISRDGRGVTEMLYVAGGVVRRGFVDASRPTKRRDGDGAVLNTYLRHGKRSPPSGTRYLAGELLAHVIHVP